MAVRSRSVRLSACLRYVFREPSHCFPQNGIHAIARPRTKGSRHTLQCVAYRNENRIGDWLWLCCGGSKYRIVAATAGRYTFRYMKMCQEFVSHRCVIIRGAKRSIGIQFRSLQVGDNVTLGHMCRRWLYRFSRWIRVRAKSQRPL